MHGLSSAEVARAWVGCLVASGRRARCGGRRASVHSAGRRVVFLDGKNAPLECRSLGDRDLVGASVRCPAELAEEGVEQGGVIKLEIHVTTGRRVDPHTRGPVAPLELLSQLLSKGGRSTDFAA